MGSNPGKIIFHFFLSSAANKATEQAAKKTEQQQQQQQQQQHIEVSECGVVEPHYQLNISPFQSTV
jgi:hypothetical protein